ncbi:MAG: methyl-accepting chemotaxis protein [Xenococcaceae cyanobacterium MO_234.B1]|nr:methyl-accepting chemotaxis protein [Xenococcaceae cyanobacterium MO_234.B1]
MITEQQSKNSELEAATSELEATSPTKSVANEFKGIGTLRRRLLTSILPIVLLPLVIASTIGYNLTEHRAKTEILEELETDIEADTLLASKTIMTFIQESFKLIDLVAANPDVIQSMKAANKKAQEQKLTQQPIAELEKKFAATKLLTTDNSLNNYLKQIVKSTQVVDLFLTEGNGFNIAFSKPTSDFVQRDEGWWQNSRQEGRAIEELKFDESGNVNVIALSQAVKDPQTGEFLGVIKASIPLKTLNSAITSYLDGEYEQYYQFQIFDSKNNFILSNIDSEDGEAEAEGDQEIDMEGVEVVGGEPIIQVIKTLVNIRENSLNLEEAQQSIAQQFGFSEVMLRQEEILSETSIVALLKDQNKIYSLSPVPNTDLVSIGVVNYEMVSTEGRSLVTVFTVTAIVLGVASIGLIIFLAEQITKPLSNLSATTQEIAKGNLDIEASLEGTLETRTLANNFNNLIKQVKESLEKQQESLEKQQESLEKQQALAEEQRQQKEQLEKAIHTLIEEVSDATEGDLTVRASLDSLEMSTVADLFNAIIDSLQEIAIEAKKSNSQVGSALKQNEEAIRFLARQAMAEAKETRDTLVSVEQMSQSIQAVAENASQAEAIADDTYNNVLNSTKDMDLTVDSILQLRTTVGETAKKMKRLGESSQKISQAVSFIEEIALKTYVLAINASVEARRAGEYGQGFTIVAEQVGALAEQSAAATKEIATIVGTIQGETEEVSQVMESGTTQVVESTRLVESTKQSLRLVLEKSQAIHHLMGSISQKTVSQANTSQDVTKLMRKIAQLSEATSISSKKVAQSIVETAEIAKKLESAVAKFKVNE